MTCSGVRLIAPLSDYFGPQRECGLCVGSFFQSLYLYSTTSLPFSSLLIFGYLCSGCRVELMCFPRSDDSAITIWFVVFGSVLKTNPTMLQSK